MVKGPRRRNGDRIDVDTELKEGDKVRVVSNVITRKYGVRVHPGPGASKHDVKAWPGEVGVVTRVPYAAHDNTPMAHWFIQFERGRRLTLHIVGDDYAGATAATFYTASDAEEFRRER